MPSDGGAPRAAGVAGRPVASMTGDAVLNGANGNRSSEHGRVAVEPGRGVRRARARGAVDVEVEREAEREHLDDDQAVHHGPRLDLGHLHGARTAPAAGCGRSRRSRRRRTPAAPPASRATAPTGCARRRGAGRACASGRRWAARRLPSSSASVPDAPPPAHVHLEQPVVGVDPALQEEQVVRVGRLDVRESVDVTDHRRERRAGRGSPPGRCVRARPPPGTRDQQSDGEDADGQEGDARSAHPMLLTSGNQTATERRQMVARVDVCTRMSIRRIRSRRAFPPAALQRSGEPAGRRTWTTGGPRDSPRS